MKTTQTRRQFLFTSTAATVAMPQLLLANKNPKQTIIGEGEHRYEVQHDFASFHDISAVDADGAEVKMSKFRGKTVLVCNVACK